MTASQQSLRKALGAIKDSTKVGLVSCLNSDNKDVEVATVKATSHDEALPKEKHIKTILDSVSSSRPRSEVAYCIQGLSKRLAKTHSWMHDWVHGKDLSFRLWHDNDLAVNLILESLLDSYSQIIINYNMNSMDKSFLELLNKFRIAKHDIKKVALKTLIVVHRALREADPSFCQEVLNFSRRGLMLNLSHFRDESSPTAWDYSAWVRKYALYLEERVECLRLLKYDVEKSRLNTKELQTADLLEQLPLLQQLLFRLLGCKPEGVVLHNGLIHYALSIVLSESIKLYVTITDGILNLVDKYFEMQRHDAARALEIYRKSGSQADSLNELYEICRGLGLGIGDEYMKIEQPPPSFLASMEEYAQQAPHSLALESPEGVPAVEARKVVPADPESDTNVKEEDQAVTPESRGDQGGANLIDLDAEAEEKSLVLEVSPPGSTSNSENDLNGDVASESKLAGGLDKLTLNSLHEQATASRVNPDATHNMGTVPSNPFESASYNPDQLHPSCSIVPPRNLPMEDMLQQREGSIAQQQLLSTGPNETNPNSNLFLDQNLPSQTHQNPHSNAIPDLSESPYCLMPPRTPHNPSPG